MPDIATWRDYAKANKGSTVVWINQSSNTDLKEVDSRGVCFAITRDWLTQYRANSNARYNFVNAFRDAGVEDPNNCIPLEYVIAQDESAAEYKAAQRELRLLESQVKLATDQGKPVPVDLEAAREIVRRSRYGEGLTAIQAFDAKDNKGIKDAIAVLQANAEPSYYMLSVRREGGGHVVGFEFRPDISASDAFPGLFEFIDANLGLYAFPSSANMLAFFGDCVWTKLYAASNYTAFELVKFDVGAGGFGKEAQI
jgi:hypothetical protein